MHTRVEIGSVNLGFLNRAMVNDLSLFDQNGSQMLRVARVSAGLDYIEILQGNIHISTAQLFSPTIQLYQDSVGTRPNYQFLIDAFSNDSEESKPLNLRINTLILRHANLSYDILAQPHSQMVDSAQGLYAIDPNHIQLNDLGMNVSLKALTDDSISVSVKRLSVTENNSGLKIDEMSFSLNANKREALLSGFSLKTPGSSFSTDSLHLFYPTFEADKSFSFSPTELRGMVTPVDFQSLLPVLNNSHTPLFFTANLSGNSKDISLDKFMLRNTAESIRMDVSGRLSMDRGELTSGSAYIKDIHFTSEGLHQILADLGVDVNSLKPINALGQIDYTGGLNYKAKELSSSGRLFTDAGSLYYKAEMDSTKLIVANVETAEFNIGRVFDNESYGVVSLTSDLKVRGMTLLLAKGHCEALSNAVDVHSDIDFESDGRKHNLRLNSEIYNLNPHALSLTKEHSGTTFSGSIDARLMGSDIDDVQGFVSMRDIRMNTDSVLLSMDALTLGIDRSSDIPHVSVSSDFLNADIDGDIYPSTLVSQITEMLHQHLPTIIKSKPSHQKGMLSNFTYTASIRPNQFLDYFLPKNFRLRSLTEIYGFMNSEIQQLSLNVKARELEYGDRHFNNILLKCDNTIDNLFASLSTIVTSDESAAKINLMGKADGSNIDSNVKLQLRGNTDINMDLNSLVSFTDSLNGKKTNIDIGKSLLTINDSVWRISPAHISWYQKEIVIHDLQISGTDNSFIKINGIASSTADNDSIVAVVNNLQIEYILDAIDFTAVNLGGKASGEIVADGLFSDNSMLRANLTVDELLFEGGSMGRAAIMGGWDNEQKAILLDAQMIQSPKPDAQNPFVGGTILHGFISPANNDIRLDITANQTDAAFLNGFLDDIFHPITGDITGTVSIIGPLDNVDMIGEVDANLTLALLATNVPYKAIRQHCSMKPSSIQFNNVELQDKYGNKGFVNGEITHRNLANFHYDFEATFMQILAYDEQTFNEDNFYATIFADGNMKIQGSDGHPMYITANITPTRGSLFAFDSASPDAITSGNFIEFNDVTPIDSTQTELTDKTPFEFFKPTAEERAYTFVWEKPTTETGDSISTRYLYKGDLYMDFHIDLNEDCQIRLRMDNNADGYITTYGRGGITCKYHNKGTLELFGTYDITRGSYRLYMQDVIYKDLTLQQGSTVEFNGAPFDASIHLICHHLVNAVPLSDLTATTAYAANNKVKVNCILDITGKLGNMAFRFNIDVLNVSDEIRQLVRSMINSEEEMNTQIIYLLALGRFYPSDMSQMVNDNTSSSAVNSLVSSTLSGQLNNLIGNLLGNNSNWNFGTGIVTGERGWNDLDVEGTLSGRLFDDRLLINGNFGYRDNTLTNQGTFVGDFEVRWRLNKRGGNLYLKAYNQTNDRYFTKSTLNTQGIGLSYIHDFETWKTIFKK